MVKFEYFLLCVISYLIVESNGGTVSFITPCKATDKECLKKSTQAAIKHFTAGIPELGVPAAEPVMIDSIRQDDVNLKLGFRNLKIFGASKCKIIEETRDVEKKTFMMIAECPVTVVGQYDLKGKLAFIEAFGEGDFEIKSNKVRIEVDVKVKEIEKNGRNYWKITSFDYSYNILEKVDFMLQNLFGGDKERAKPILEALHYGGKEIIDEVGGPIIKQLISKYVDLAKKFFLAVPIDELELP